MWTPNCFISKLIRQLIEKKKIILRGKTFLLHFGIDAEESLNWKQFQFNSIQKEVITSNTRVHRESDVFFYGKMAENQGKWKKNTMPSSKPSLPSLNYFFIEFSIFRGFSDSFSWMTRSFPIFLLLPIKHFVPTIYPLESSVCIQTI